MGYTTDFKGQFTFDKDLTSEQIEYINMLSETRRMKRNNAILAQMKQEGKGNTRCFELLVELGLGFGENGEYYCGHGSYGQERDESIMEYNYAPGEAHYNDTTPKPKGGQPGLWCQWVIPEGETNVLEWNGAEKFYNYVEWLIYLIDRFFKPWGYKLNGAVTWYGEDRSDYGVIIVKDNAVTKHEHIESAPSEKVSPPVPVMEKETCPVKDQSEIVLDLIKLRNELANSKKGTAVACKKLDALIAKYEA